MIKNAYKGMYVAINTLFFLIRFGILLCITGIGTVLALPYSDHLLEDEIPVPRQKHRNEGLLPIHSRRNAFDCDCSALDKLGNHASDWRIHDAQLSSQGLPAQKY